LFLAVTGSGILVSLYASITDDSNRISQAWSKKIKKKARQLGYRGDASGGGSYSHGFFSLGSSYHPSPDDPKEIRESKDAGVILQPFNDMRASFRYFWINGNLQIIGAILAMAGLILSALVIFVS